MAPPDRSARSRHEGAGRRQVGCAPCCEEARQLPNASQNNKLAQAGVEASAHQNEVSLSQSSSHADPSASPRAGHEQPGAPDKGAAPQSRGRSQTTPFNRSWISSMRWRRLRPMSIPPLAKTCAQPAGVGINYLVDWFGVNLAQDPDHQGLTTLAGELVGKRPLGPRGRRHLTVPPKMRRSGLADRTPWCPARSARQRSRCCSTAVSKRAGRLDDAHRTVAAGELVRGSGRRGRPKLRSGAPTCSPGLPSCWALKPGVHSCARCLSVPTAPSTRSVARCWCTTPSSCCGQQLQRCCSWLVAEGKRQQVGAAAELSDASAPPHRRSVSTKPPATVICCLWIGP